MHKYKTREEKQQEQKKQEKYLKETYFDGFKKVNVGYLLNQMKD